jgi:hypothetical protein
MNARYLVVPMAAALLAVPAARAQQPSAATAGSAATDSSTAIPVSNSIESAAPTAPTVASPAAGPTRDAAVAGVHRASTATATSTEAAAQRSRGYGQAQALVIVGGVAVIAGLIIGGGAGYAIAVGGAIVGLFGLYQYLQ